MASSLLASYPLLPFSHKYYIIKTNHLGDLKISKVRKQHMLSFQNSMWVTENPSKIWIFLCVFNHQIIWIYSRSVLFNGSNSIFTQL
ncbi:hypothetical protein L6452_13979 [Arctium lappa]|uniref:Uncharacterized protein n=1 Tax=Arctium lappa TaxID=4217 RepID=A0ACB9CJT1_ARCLA|nr:hypothetical protein L6452_13979 [Arctium lappa]